MAIEPHDIHELEHQLSRLDSFRRLSNWFICENKRNWNQEFLENLFTLLCEMGDAAKEAFEAFHGPDAGRPL